MVDTLMLRSRSPPVPQVSMTSMPAGRSRGTAWATMDRTKPVISSTDSPLARRAVTRAAIRAGEAAPDSTWPITVSAESAVSDVPASRSVRTPGPAAQGLEGRSDPAASSSTLSAAPSSVVAPVDGSPAISPTTDRGRARRGR